MNPDDRLRTLNPVPLPPAGRPLDDRAEADLAALLADETAPHSDPAPAGVHRTQRVRPLSEADASAPYRGGQSATSPRTGTLRRPAGVGPVRRAGRTRRALAAVIVLIVGVLVAGQVNMTAQSAHAAGLLRSTAGHSLAFVDPAPGPGQFLLIHSDGDWLGSETTENGDVETFMTEQRIDVYVPHDPDDDWVLDRESGPARTMPGWEWSETLRAPNGEFYGTPWTVPWTESDLRTLPRDGQALLDLFDGQYNGGSASRSEDNFVRITDLLRSGLVPADLRAGLYEALALIPGVTTSEQTNLHGQVGIAIGRTEPLRLGERLEVIIDPDTGLVIGERTVNGWEAFGFGPPGELTGHTAIEYHIVDTAPRQKG